MSSSANESRSGSNPLTLASRWVLAVGLAGSALAVGTVHTITLCVVTAVLAVAAVLGWWGAEPMKPRSAATLLLLTGIGLTAYTAIQCVPIPIRWLALIAPHNADVWSRALSPLHESGPTWAPISLDPAATRVEVLKGVAYLLAFLTALGVARRREGIAFLSGTIALTGLALAVAALLHPAFKSHSLFGVYDPGPTIQGRHVAPLMNPNNLAGYLNLALCLSFAVVVAPHPRIPRPIAGAAALLLGATQVWVASRGGVATMVLGALIVVGIAYWTRAPQSRPTMSLALGTGLAMIVGASLIVISGSEEASSELRSTDISKLNLVGAALRLVRSMPLFGCGRGAFESVFPAFRTDPGYVTYTHPENVIAQWIVEWGLPVGAAGLAAIAFALRPTVVLARSTTAAGAWAGVVALTVQNLGDLGTEIPGLVIAGVTCAAIVVAGTPGGDPQWQVERWSHRPGGVALGAGVAALAALALGVGALGRDLHEDQKAMHDAVMVGHASTQELHAKARDAMLRHPAEPYLPYAVAMLAMERGDNPIPWIGATLERAQVYGPAHLVLARAVARRSPSQARFEYRLAMEQAPVWVGVEGVTREATRVVGSYFDATELVPEGKAGPSAMDLLAQAIKERLPATRVRLDLDLLARSSTARGPTLRLAEDAVSDLTAGDEPPWCQGPTREACLRDAISKAGRVEEVSRDKCQGYALRAKARMSGWDVAGATEELERATDRVTDRVTCLKELVVLTRGAGNSAATEAALDKIVAAGCGDPAECAQNLLWAAQAYENAGQLHKALALYRRAMAKKVDSNWYTHMAPLAARAGLHAEAAEDYEKLAHWNPDNPEWRRLALEEHDAAMRGIQHLP